MSPEQLTPKELVDGKIANLRSEIAQGRAVTETFPIGEMGFLLQEIFSLHPETGRTFLTCRVEGYGRIRVMGTTNGAGPITSLPGLGDIRSAEVVLSTSQSGEVEWKLEKLNGKGGLLLALANKLIPKPFVQHEMALGQYYLLQAHAQGFYAIGADGSFRTTFSPLGRRY